MKRSKQFFRNAVVLCATSVALRLIGIFFNAYIISKVGAAGMGLFQLIMSVYFLFITLASSGIGMAATRIVAEELAEGRQAGIKAAVKKTLLYSAALGCAACLFLLLLSKQIGAIWLGDVRTITSLRILAAGLPFIAMSSVIKGYFTAVRRVALPSAVDVAEQLTRIAIIAYLITYLLPSGLEYACIAIALGNSFGELLSFSLLCVIHLFDRRRYWKSEAGHVIKSSRIFKISLPLALNAYLRAGFQSVSKLLVPTTLKRYGMPQDRALAEFGTVHGMAFPIIQLPEIILVSFASLLVPEFSEFNAKKDTRAISRALGRVLRATFLFSIGIIGVLSCFSKELSVLVYSDASAALYLASLAPFAMLMYLDKVVDCVLTALNQQVNSMYYNLCDSVITTVLILVLIPKFGMLGYLAAMFAGKAVNMWMSLARLIKVTNIPIKCSEWVVCPLIAMLLSISVVLLLRQLTHFLTSEWYVLAGSLVGLYVLQLKAMGCLQKNSIRFMNTCN